MYSSTRAEQINIIKHNHQPKPENSYSLYINIALKAQRLKAQSSKLKGAISVTTAHPVTPTNR